MKRNRKAALVLLLFLAASCATVGTGDPAVVRAEDLLTNSLSTYSLAMDFHFKHSTQESPEVYKTFETFRMKFPMVWTALDNAKRDYQKNKATSGILDASIKAVVDLLSTVTPLIVVK